MLERILAACLVAQMFLVAKAGDPMEEKVPAPLPDPVKLPLPDPFPLPLPVPVSRCIRSCQGLKDGDYQSCKGCNVYASCVGGILYDQRPCATASLVWDDNKKRCEYTSPTCGTGNTKGCVKDGKLYRVGESVLSDDPCDSCTRCKKGGEFKCFKRDCAAPPCENPVRVPGRCCPVCKGCTGKDGTSYRIGDRVPSEKPCESCSCALGGDVVCFPIAISCAEAECDNPVTVKGQCCPICPEVCSLPVKTGPCEAIIPRFAYDYKLKKCRSFDYGGCGGNGNNFELLADCRAVCKQQPKDKCTKNNKEYNRGDNIPTKNPCRERCRCTEGGVTSCFRIAVKCARPQCKNPKRVKGKCCPVCPTVCTYKKRTYKEGQNFRDKDTCKICKCRNGKVSCGRKACPRYKCKTRLIKVKGRCCPICQPPACEQPKDAGRCLAAIRRYFYNKKTGRCERFIYGGCGGNNNNFKDLKTCEKLCGSSQENVCRLPKTVGPCKAILQRYYYNSKTGKCTQFTYGECRGNKNNFKSFKACICRLAKAVGPCRGSFQRYYYNFKTSKCTMFTYGGCRGNKNNFKSFEACNKRCGKKTPVNVCRLPKTVGPCKAVLQRYYYNFKTGKCTKFTYGGCRGNKNNFKSFKACKQRCGKKPPVKVCRLPKTVGPCKAAIQRYYYNIKTGKCTKFTYGGCRGNKNNFKSFKACNKRCGKKPPNNVCRQAKDIGPCRGSFQRYYYNFKTRKCTKFTYGGCRGNKNNFKSFNDCNKRCGKKTPVNVCRLPKTIGPCKAALQRYYYNFKTGKCTKFTYGGCRGNKNNFKSFKACKQRCGKKPPVNVCRLPKTIGPCKAALQRYYYNFKTGKCTKFTYGGCRGNKNNFKSFKACKQRCGKKPPVNACKLPKKVGRCRARKRRYYYNKKARKCVLFYYGGCGGNKNNFKSLKQCQKTCMG